MAARTKPGQPSQKMKTKPPKVSRAVDRVLKDASDKLPLPAVDDFQVLSQLPVPFSCLNEMGIILRCNESFGEMVGTKFQKPRDIFELLEQEDAAKLQQGFEFVVKWSQPSCLRLSFGSKKGVKRVFEARIQLMVSHGERLFCCLFWPVDENSSLEQGKNQINVLEKALAQKTLELAEQHSYFETFCYTASHDLRTPLRSIKGFADALMEDYASAMEPEALDFLHRVTTSAAHMDRMFEGILQLSRILRIRPEIQKIHVGILLEQMVASQAESVSMKKASVELFSCNATLKTDPVLLEKICQELFKNALAYREKENPVVVKISCSQKSPEKTLEIRFEDNGCGVPAPARDQIFIPFERLHFGPEHNGVGMGLAIVRAAVQKLGGKVALSEKSSGPGSVFTVSLPSS
ncbi:MAG: putative Multi-sensor signal transduction histidine kinase [Verrucomicrobiales bacterium]|nr:putative Multi-sensor signal transduction histidine kinase [Verrucomicrobiales bacterium]